MAVFNLLSSLAPSWAMIGLALLLYWVVVAVYRLYLHPLAKFPGRKLAALTLFYEFYWNGVHRGQYIFRIKEMHEQYGPIIRIAPNELHILDPEYIPELYPSGGRKRDKYRRAMQEFGFYEAAIATPEHDIHRMRRAPIARMFSKDNVRRLEPIMQKNLGRLISRLLAFKDTGKELNVLPVYSAFTNDLIAEYAFGENWDWLNRPGFNKDFFDVVTKFHEQAPMANLFSWFMPLMDMIPLPILQRLNPGMKSFISFKADLARKIDRVVARHREGKNDHTVFDEILDSNLSDHEKRPERLLEESQNIAIAGTETTAWTLSVIQFHLLRSPTTLSKLRSELISAIPDMSDPPQLKDLEQLPYLTALISEGLRLSMGTSNKQFRIAPDEELQYTDQSTNKTWIIPRGTPVAMTTPWIHLNPSIFPEPLLFRPERWIENPKLKRYLMSFSQGSRQCMGMQLAYAELYMVLSGVWRRFGGPETKSEEVKEEGARFRLFETDERDVEMEYDMFVPYGKRDSKGIRVVVES